MSAAILWIFLPGLTAFGLWFLRRRSGLVILIATGLCLALAGLAWIMPIGKALRLGPLLLELEPALSIAGRRLVLADTDRPVLTFFYAIAAFWFAGTLSTRGHRLLNSLRPRDHRLAGGGPVGRAVFLCRPINRDGRSAQHTHARSSR